MPSTTLPANLMYSGSTEPTLAQTLRELRRREGLTIRDAAKRFGVSHSRLGYFERGRAWGTKRPAVPSREVIERIAEVYGYPRESLLTLAGYTVIEPVPAPRPSRTDAEAAEIAEIYRRLPEPHRRLLLKMARVYKQDITPGA